MSNIKNENPKSDQPLENDFNNLANDISLKIYKEFSKADRKFVLDFVDLFSAIKNKPLKLFFIPKEKKHFITFNIIKNQYEIYTDPYDKNIFWKTALEHELSHFIFDTSITTFKKHMNKIIKNVPYELINISKKSVHTIYNILEDMRIESMLGKIQLGSRYRFIETRKHLGSLSKDIPKDPITALLDSRFFRSDLVNKSNWKIANDYINRSEFLDPKGSILLTNEYFDKVVLPFLIKQKQKEKDKQEKENQKDISNNKNKKGDTKEESDSDKESDSDNEESDNEESDNEESDNEESDNEESDKESDSDNEESDKESDSDNEESDKESDSDNEESDNEESDKESDSDNEESDNEESDKESDSDNEESDKESDSDNEESDNEESDKESDSDNEESDKESDSDNEESDNEESDKESDSDNEESDNEESDNEESDNEKPKDVFDLPNESDPPEIINTLEDLEKLLDSMIKNSDHSTLENTPTKNIIIDFDEIEKQLDKSNENGLKELKELKEKLLSMDHTTNKYDPLIEREYSVNDYTDQLNNNSYKIDYNLAQKLSNIFNEIKGKRKNTLDIKGSQININQYVNSKFNSSVRVFKNELKSVGFNLVIVTDMSGSMNQECIINNESYSKAEIATNTIATMFKSLEKFNQIKLTVIGFSGHNNRLDKVQINKLNKVGILNNTIDCTPLDLGLIEAKKQLDKMNGKKFVIVLTDGEPDQYVKDVHEYMNYLIDTLFIKKQIGIFGILIGNNYESMRKMFNQNFATCDPENTQTELLKIFEKTIKGYLS